MIAVELEVLAKKFDRFGWERDRNKPAHDRQIIDWMDALQDYPLHEIRAACRAAVLANPDRMPNEGHIVAKITEARRQFVQANRQHRPEPAPKRQDQLTPEDLARRKAVADSLLADFARRGK